MHSTRSLIEKLRRTHAISIKYAWPRPPSREKVAIVKLFRLNSVGYDYALIDFEKYYYVVEKKLRLNQ